MPLLLWQESSGEEPWNIPLKGCMWDTPTYNARIE